MQHFNKHHNDPSAVCGKMMRLRGLRDFCLMHVIHDGIEKTFKYSTVMQMRSQHPEMINCRFSIVKSSEIN